MIALRWAVPAVLFLSVAAFAQERPAPDPATADAVVIAVPPLATAKITDTDAGTTWELANQISGLISADLNSTGGFIVADVTKVRIPSFPEVTAPAYPQWRAARTKLLLSGFVNARADGRLTIGCYLYDVQAGRELGRQGFALAPAEWRRAAHRCADIAYTKTSGNPPLFDSRIAYVAQSGREESPSKRIAVMDFDGADHSFITAGDSTVLTPRWSPNGDRIAYTSFAGGRLHVRLIDIASRSDRPLLPLGDSFAAAFSPQGQAIALSIAVAGNTDVFTLDYPGAVPRRLTTSPAIDTSPSYSPDGTRIVFASDRSGTQQIYVMDSDGSNQRRISFGPGDYGSPVWSPDGERIAFANVQGVTSRIGVMRANGSDERIVTLGPSDEQPSWSPDSGRILFQRLVPEARREGLAMVPVGGGEVRSIPTPQGATDPAWARPQE